MDDQLAAIKPEAAAPSTEEPGLLDELDRMSRRMRISAGGLVFFILLTVVMSIRRAIMGHPVVVNEDTFIKLIWLIALGGIIVPIAYMIARRTATRALSGGPRARYSRLLLIPLWISLACLPLLAIEPIWAEAAIVGCALIALSLGDLLALIWLRRFPPQARVVETKKLLKVYKI